MTTSSTPKRSGSGASKLNQESVSLSRKDIRSIEVVDTDIVITTQAGKKVVIRDGALRAMLNPDFSIKLDDLAIQGQAILQNAQAFSVDSVAKLTGRNAKTASDEAADAPASPQTSPAPAIAKTPSSSEVSKATDASSTDSSSLTAKAQPEGAAVSGESVANTAEGRAAAQVGGVAVAPVVEETGTGGFIAGINPAWGALGALGALGGGGGGGGDAVTTIVQAASGGTGTGTETTPTAVAVRSVLNIVLGEANAALNYIVKSTTGEVLASGTTTASDGGVFSLEIKTSYTGPVEITVSDPNSTDGLGYRDEFTGQSKNLETTVRALAVLKADTVNTFNITPLTELATRWAYDSKGGKGTLSSLTDAAVEQANTKVAKALNLVVDGAVVDIVGVSGLTALNDSTPPSGPGATLYSQVLAALSGYDGKANGSFTNTLKELSTSILSVQEGLDTNASVGNILTNGAMLAMDALVKANTISAVVARDFLNTVFTKYTATTNLASILLDSTDKWVKQGDNTVLLNFSKAQNAADILAALKIDGVSASAFGIQASDLKLAVGTTTANSLNRQWVLNLRSGLQSIQSDADKKITLKYESVSGTTTSTSNVVELEIGSVPPVLKSSGLSGSTGTRIPTYEVVSDAGLTNVRVTLTDANGVSRTFKLTANEASPTVYAYTLKASEALQPGPYTAVVSLADRFGNVSSNLVGKPFKLVGDPTYSLLAGDDTGWVNGHDDQGNPTYDAESLKDFQTRYGEFTYIVNTVEGAEVIVIIDGKQLRAKESTTVPGRYEALISGLPSGEYSPSVRVKDIQAQASSYLEFTGYTLVVDTQGPALKTSLTSVAENLGNESTELTFELPLKDNALVTGKPQDVKFWDALGGEDAKYFEWVDAGHTHLKFKATTDFEVKSVYRITLTAYDVVGNATTQSFTVDITNRNEAPVVAKAVTTTYAEDASADTQNWVVVDLLEHASDVDLSSVANAEVILANLTGASFRINGVDVDAFPEGLVQMPTDGKTLKFNLSHASLQALALGEQRVYTLNYQVKDKAGLSVPQTATITVTGTNDAPTIEAGVQVGDLMEDDASQASASISLSLGDVDGTASYDAEALVQDGWTDEGNGSFIKAGTYGRATLEVSTGRVSYALDNTLAATQALKADQSVTEDFRVVVKDADGGTASATASFTLTGTNDAPTIKAGVQVGDLVEDDASKGTASISLSLGDVDGTASYDAEALVQDGWTDEGNGSFSKAGTYGKARLEVNTGRVSYALDNTLAATQALKADQSVTEDFRVVVKDTDGGTASATASFKLTGTNDAPTIEAGVQVGDLVEDDEGQASASISFSWGDVDGTASYDADAMATAGWTKEADGNYSRAGTYGKATLEVSTGRVSYALDNTLAATQALKADQSVTEDFTVVVKDTDGGTASATASFSITGTNDAPTIKAGEQVGDLVEDDASKGTASISLTLADVDGAASYDADAMATAGWTKEADGNYSRAGTYGKVTLEVNTGLVRYALDNTLAATQALKVDQSVTEDFTVVVKDADGGTASATASFTLTGTNDAPTIEAGVQVGDLVEDDASKGTASISLSLGDVDGTASYDDKALVQDGWTDEGNGSFIKAGTYGRATLEVSTGRVSYALDNTLAATQALKADQSVTEDFRVVVKDADGGTASATASFTLTGTNDAPTIEAGVQVGDLVEDDASKGTASISLSLGDVDGTASYDDKALVQDGWTDEGNGNFSKAGTYGKATLDTTSHKVSYELDADKAQALSGGQPTDESFSIALVDDAEGKAIQNVTFKIQGVNDAPTIEAGVQVGDLVEDDASQASASISLSVGDVDGTASYDEKAMNNEGWSKDANHNYTKSGTYGKATLEVSTGRVSYALDNTLAATQALKADQSVTEDFTVVVKDADGGTASATASFTLTGTNDAPTIEAGVQVGDLVEDDVSKGTASISLSLGDVDGTASYDDKALVQDGWTDEGNGSFSKAGSYGKATLEVSTGRVSYALDNTLAATQALKADQSVTEDFRVVVKDADGGTASATASFTLTGTNDAPTIEAGVQVGDLVEDDASKGTASISLSLGDVDGTASYDDKALVQDGWTDEGNGSFIKAGTYGRATLEVSTGRVSYALDNTLAATQALKADQSVTEDFRVVVKDADGGTASATASFTLTGTNDAPTIKAGVQVGDLVEDDASKGTASISLSLGDVDGTASYDAEALVQDGWTDEGNGSFSKGGIYGTVKLNASSGQLSYALNNERLTTQALKGSDSVADSFKVTTVDDAGQTNFSVVKFKIQGVNDAPTIEAGVQVGDLVEDDASKASASITLTVDDVEGSVSFKDDEMGRLGWSKGDDGNFILDGTYGKVTLTANTAVVNYVLDPKKAQALQFGMENRETFTVVMVDGEGAVVRKNLSFTLTGTNDAPTIKAGVQVGTLLEDDEGQASASISLSLGDVDGTASYDADAMATAGWTKEADGNFTKAGSYGKATLEVSTGRVSYALDNSRPTTQALKAKQSVTEDFRVVVKDADGGTASATASFTLTGTNDAPTIEAVVQSSALVEDDASKASASIDLVVVDVDGTASYDADAMATAGWTKEADGNFSKAGTYGKATLDTASHKVSYELDADKAQALSGGQPTDESFSIALVDDAEGKAIQNVTFKIQGVNDAPTIKAGVQEGKLMEDDNDHNSASITLSVGDVDGTASYDFDAMTTEGGWYQEGTYYYLENAYGVFELDPSLNTVKFTLDFAADAVQKLKVDQHETPKAIVKVKDADGGTASVTVSFDVMGTIDVPVIQSLGKLGRYSLGEAVEISYEDLLNKASITDADGDTAFVFKLGTIDATKGTLEISQADGSWKAASVGDTVEAGTKLRWTSDPNIPAAMDVEAFTVTAKVADGSDGDLVSAPMAVRFDLKAGFAQLQSFVAGVDARTSGGTEGFVMTADGQNLMLLNSVKDVGATVTLKAKAGTYDYLVVGGGGGGGSRESAGGGGAGGVLKGQQTLTGDAELTVTVGAGGQGATWFLDAQNKVVASDGANGQATTVVARDGAWRLTALGGGGGGGTSATSMTTGADGASGGGGGGQSTAASPATSQGGVGVDGQGHAGGNGFATASTDATSRAGGGGGGAGGVGEAALSKDAGNGGVGVASDITGVNAHYGGGGGGGVRGNNVKGLGGSGGGGMGGDGNLAAGDGVANTGGGGGGAGAAVLAKGEAFSYGGDGGSGVAYLRFDTGADEQIWLQMFQDLTGKTYALTDLDDGFNNLLQAATEAGKVNDVSWWTGYNVAAALDKAGAVAANQGPAIDLKGTTSAQFVLRQAQPVAVALDGDMVLSDNGTHLKGASVVVGGWQLGDSLSWSAEAITASGLSVSYSETTGGLSLSGVATLAQYQAVLRSVGFKTSGTDTSTRTVSWTVTDSLGQVSTQGNTTVTVKDPDVATGTLKAFMVQVEAQTDGGTERYAMSADGQELMHLNSFTEVGAAQLSALAGSYDYLVVGGGGGGGSFRSAGGGGAGGVQALYQQTLASDGTFKVMVGAGGHGGAPYVDSNSVPAQGSNGEASSLSFQDSTWTLIALGGGGGGGGGNASGNSTYEYSKGLDGASGGGGGAAGLVNGQINVSEGGKGTAGQGHEGGLANSTTGAGAQIPNRTGGGGGGAGELGAAGQAKVSGDGGDGVSSDITGETAWYGGGGGGGVVTYEGTLGAGGQGGGGSGGKGPTTVNTVMTGAINAADGRANTGGGGGGGGSSSSSNQGQGGQGGSGLVVVRFDTGATEAELLDALRLITGKTNLQASSLATYLNAIEAASATGGNDWWTQANIASLPVFQG